jgi:hypothetical protein
MKTESYGYFYKESEPTNGRYIPLPNGHNEKDRDEAAIKEKVEWDLCMLLYKDADGEYIGDDGKVPKPGNEVDEEVAIAVNKAGKSYLVQRKTFEKEERKE